MRLRFKRANFRIALLILFMGFHLLSVIWWMSTDQIIWPSKNERSGNIETLGYETALYRLRTAVDQTRFPKIANFYLKATGTWQNWKMFAPNPPRTTPIVTVKAVKEWGNDHSPIYDSQPLYQSYAGFAEDYLPGSQGAYDHDTKAIERIVRNGRSPFLREFTRYWANHYLSEHGYLPKAIHVIVDNVPIATYTDEGKISVEMSERDIAWQIQY